MPDHDPNGESWEAWKRAGYDSYEKFIESKAGACPPDDCKDLGPANPGDGEPETRIGDHSGARETLRASSPGIGPDWPMPKPPPFLADDEGSDDPAEA